MAWTGREVLEGAATASLGAAAWALGIEALDGNSERPLDLYEYFLDSF